MQRTQTTVRLLVATCVAAAVGILVPGSATADFVPDPFDSATAGTAGIFTADFSSSTVGAIPAGWTGDGWLVRNSTLSSPMPIAPAPTGVIPVLSGNYVALDNSAQTSGTITSPIIDLTTATNPYLTFDVHSFFLAGDEGNQGYDTDKSYVQINVLTAAGVLLDQVFELGDTDINGAAGWLPQRVRLADFAGQQVRLQIIYVDEGAASNNDQHDIALDNIEVVDVPVPDGTDRIPEIASATYFLPLSAADVAIAQSHVYSNVQCGRQVGPQDTVTMLTSITIGDTPVVNGIEQSALVLYDHVEDGFGPTNRRTQASTELWGDGDPSNGFPPGHPEDLLYPGEVIVMRTISDPGVATPNAPGSQVNSYDSTAGYTLDYDAGDRLTSPVGLVITRVGWNDGSSTLLAGAVEVSDVGGWGTAYEMPVGQNLTTSGLVPNSFGYVSASVMARNNGTVVTYPGGTVTLGAGESFLINGGLLVGDEITSSGGSISVNVMAGSVCSTFEGRWFRLDPVRLFDDVYYTPVGPTSVGANPTPSGGTSVLLYNPGSTAITIDVFDSASATVPRSTVTVAAGTTARYNLTVLATGASFVARNEAPFYAVQAYDTGSTQRDWGFALLGLDQLSPVLQAGLAIGVDPTSGNTTDINSPLWIAGIWSAPGTPSGGVTICIDWNGNGGPNTTNGVAYDITRFIDAHLDNEILDEADLPPTNDLTGTKVFVCNPANPTDPNLANWVLAGAWGQDTSGPGGSPSIDVGTGVFNLPTFSMDKALTNIEDDNNNGIVDVGDTVRYTLTVKNTSGVAILANRLKIWDNLPVELDYIEGSTKISPELAPLGGSNPETVPDDSAPPTLVPTSFPLDDANPNNGTFDDPNNEFTDTVDDGVWWNRPLLGGESITFTFDTEILQVPANNLIVNTAYVTDGRVVRSDLIAFEVPEFITVGDRVWLDEDGDGVQDAGEDGVAGVPVTLTYTPFDGVPVILTTVTDSDGGYVFTGLPVLPVGGTFTVTIAAPAGMDPTYDEQGPLDLTIVLVSDPLSLDASNPLALQPGDQHMTADFGLNWVPPVNTDTGTGVGAIGDRIWSDADGDGVQDPGEPGIAGVTVNLFTDADGDGVYDTPAGTAVTDANGNYIFDDLAPTVYVVVVDASTLPGGVTQSGDPDAVLDNSSTPIPLAPGDVYVNADFGYQPAPGSANDNTIGDTVWLDGNGDGVIDPNEPGIGGVSVVLLDAAGNVVATTQTDSDGNYLFSGVPSGTYQVWVNDAANVLGEFAQISDPDGVLDGRNTVTVTSGDDILTADFGYAPPDSDLDEGLIGDTVFVDANGNGVADPGEGIEGVRVELYDEFDRLVGVTYTNENGQYAFGDLAATIDGPYLIVVDTTTLPSGLIPSVDPDGGADSSASTLLGEGQQIYTMDFGYVSAQPATLSGTIWEDVDADGILDAAEGDRFAGVTVVLTQLVDQTIVITDPDTQLPVELVMTVERVVGVATTDANGNYSFTGLTGGAYIVRVTDDANVVGGYWHSDAPTPGTNGQSQDDEGYAVTLAPGGTNSTADFGYYIEPGAVGNTVFDDVNGNGVQDNGEVGIADATVQLVITYPDGTQTTMVTTTDAAGNYEFGNLLLDEDHNGDLATAGVPEPTFLISVIDLPAAYADAVSTHSQSATPVDSTTIGGTPADDLDADNPAGEPAFPGQGVTDTTNDFGFVNEAVIGDLVWEDLDGDGILDAGEPGIGGVVVNLYRDGVLTASVTTSDGTVDLDGDGIPEPLGTYLFTDLLPGDYVVEFIAPADHVFSPANQGGDDAADSDANALGRTTTITVVAGQTELTIDAGLYVPVAIGDLVFDDANGNGTYDGATTDPGIGGVTVTLYEDTTGDGIGDTIVRTTTTITTPTDINGDGIVDPIGSYWFDDLAPGSYSVVVETATGPVAASDNWGNTVDPDGTLDAQTTTAITLTSGQTNTDQDFGFFRPAVIGDTIFYDADNNGVQDPGETGLDGVTVELIDAGGSVVQTQITAGGGLYLFEDVVAGTYTVRVDTTTLPVGFDDAINSADPDGGVASESSVTVVAGESNLDQDFGYFDPGTIGDTVFHDVNGDGIQGDPADEPGIGGVTVELRNSDGDVIDTQITSPTGQYFFTDLTDGTYTVTVVTSTLPAAFQPAINSADPDAASDKDAPGNATSTVDLDSAGDTLVGVSDLTQDFGFFIPASIGDRVFEDANNNGLQDAGEPGFGGVTVNLLDAAGVVIATDTTTAGGFYSFDNLAPGDYTVQVDESTLPVGAVQTYEKATAGNTLDGSTDQTVVVGDDITDVDFGYFRPATIGDYVWDDLDGDGIQDADEPGVSGVTVQLVDDTGTVVLTTTTDADGLYSFTDVIPGDYTVRFTIPNGDYIFSPADQGTDDALDSDALDNGDNNVRTAETAPFTVNSGDLIDTIDAGLVQTGSLGDLVWDDVNGDGIQDAGEPGIAGATVTLYAVGNPTPLNSFTTLTDGLYTFDDLAPGDYYVVVTPPTSDVWLISPQFATGATDTTSADDSDIDATGTSGVATVGIGEVVTTLDAGFVRAASLGDRVWQDLDGNGSQDAGEPGVPDITVELLDASGAVIDTTTTGPTGIYSFTGLYPGVYSVQFTAPAGNVFSPQDAPIADDASDSDAGATGLTAPVTVAAGDEITTVDAGLIETGSIGDRVWNDIDGDGIQDSGEPGVPGIKVDLLDATGAVIDTTTTGSTGLYSFTGLVPGDYSVQFANTTTTDTYIFSPQGIGTNNSVDSDADPATGLSGTITLTHGQDIDTVDAGLVLPATISGVVTEDITDDTTGDLPLAGVTVDLYLDTDGDGAPDGDPVQTTTTGPDGGYTFTDLLPGDYVVVETNPAGYIDIADTDTTDDADLFDQDTTVDSTVPVTLAQGETDDGNDFVDRLPASIEIIKTAGTAADGVDYVAPGVVGTVIDFAFVVTNTGVAPLTNVTVTDPFAGLSTIDCAPLANGSISLASGDSVTCAATYQLTQSDIDGGALQNTATVTAERPGGDTADAADDVTDTDPATVSIPREPSLTIVKVTNGVDHTAAPGLIVATGDPITWTYTVTNTGNVALADVTVTDDAGTSLVTGDDITATYVGGDTDLDDLLDVGEIWVFEATGVAAEGQYGNVAVATGNPVDDNGVDIPGVDAPTADDDDFYFAATASIEIQKTVALGADADCATGVENVDGVSGTAVTYCFLVTNTGNVRLDGVVVNDADLGITDLAVAAALLPGASATVSVNATIAGDLLNTAVATGTPIDTVTDPLNPAPFDPTVVAAPTDDDTASVDETPTFTVVKTNDANGDATYSDTEAQTSTPAVEPFQVTITNDGVDAIVVDSITDAVAGVDRVFTDLVCLLDGQPFAAGDSLAGGATVTCTFTALVDLRVAANEIDVITVVASDADGDGPATPQSDDSTVLAPDRAELGGVVYEDTDGNGTQDSGEPGISAVVVTVTPPADIDLGAGLGQPITLPVSDGTVDVNGDAVADPAGSYYLGNLLPGDYVIDVATDDPYQQFEDPDGVADNTTTVTLVAGGSDVDNDFGYAQPTLDIEKATNGEDADDPTGPFVATGDTVTWTYTVTNTGVVAVTGLVVTDDPSPVPAPAYVSGDTGADGILSPGEAWLYQATGTAIDGQFANVATANGSWTDSTGTDQIVDADTDPSHYVGLRPEIVVEKTVTLGTTCPGGELVSGANGTAVTYCFEISNTGNVLLEDVQFSDADLGVALADLTPVSGVAPVAGVLDLAPGESATFSAAATIDGDLLNTATVNGTPVDTFTNPGTAQPFPDGVVGPAGVIDVPTDSDTAAVDETPTFTVVKSNDADGDGNYTDTESAQAAISTVPFQVIITNTGGDPLTFTSISDAVGTVDRPLTDLSCVLASTGAAIAVGDSIPAGDVVTCTFSAEVDLTTAAAETDVITVELSDDDGNTVPDTDDSTVEGAADITHVKTFVSATDPEADGIYRVIYTVQVTNAGTTTDTYSIDEQPAFDTDITIDAATATAGTTGTNTPATPADYLGSPWTLATDQALAPGEVHTFTLTFTVDATAVVDQPSLLDPCVATPGTPGAGLFNQAILTVDGVDTPAEACGDLPLLTIDKTFVSATDADGDATFDVTYTVAVSNVGTAATTYGLADSPQPDTDILIVGGAATVDTDGANTPATPTAWTANPWVLATAQSIAAGETHTFTLVFQADAGALFTEPTLLDRCTTGTPAPGEGLFNEATVTSPAGSLTDQDCGDPQLPIVDLTKTFVSATDANADGTYEVVYTQTVTNAGDGAGVYDLVDLPEFDSDLTIVSAAATVVTDGVVTPPTPATYAASPWTLADRQVIPAGETHTFTLTFVVDATAVVADPAVLAPCSPTPVEGEGLFNQGVLSYDGVTIVDEACGDLPLLLLDKTFVSAVDSDGDGTFVVTYTVEVANAGTSATTYDLSDSPQPDTDITLASGTAAAVTDGANTPATPAAYVGNPWTLATAQLIAAGETHTYTLTFEADASALIVDPTLYNACDPVTPVAGEGVFNEATLTSDAGTITAEDCGDPGIPEIALTKTFVSALDADNNGVYDVVYTVVATNTGTGTGVYDGVDTPSFDSDLVILGGTATVTSTTGANVPATPPTYSSGTWTLAPDQALAAGEAHTYTLTFEVDATAVVADPTLLTPCGPTPVAGEGLFNEAGLTYADVVLNDDACGDLPLLTIDKQGPTISTDLDADGEIDLGDTLGYTIIVTNAGGVALTGVTVDDTIIAPADIICVRADASGFDHVNGAPLAVGEVVTCTGTYVVVANDVIAGEVVNVATADSDETPPVDDSVTGQIPPAITIDKTVVAPVSLGNGQYRITYTIEVGNTGSAGTYSLDDVLQFGGGITIDAAGVANTVPGTITTNPSWNGTSNVVVVSDASPAPLGYNETHVYVVTVDATVDPAVAIPDGVTCPAAGSGDNGGFANTATVSMDDDVVADDACAPPPAPELTISKQVTSGPTLNSDGTYEIQYLVTVRNQTNGVGLYDLVDDLEFGGGIVVLDAEMINVAPGTIPVLTTWNGVDATLAVDDAPITALDVHTYRVTVNADALALESPAAGDCDPETPPTAGGFLNIATVTYGTAAVSADDCAPVPPPGLSISKLVSPDSPVSNGDGTYTVTYTVNVINSEAGPGRYSLSDDLAFGTGVEMLSAGVTSTNVANDLSGWAGTGSIVTDVPITGITTHSYSVVVVARILPTMTTIARDCTLDQDEIGTGFLNGADLIVGGEIIDQDDACVQAPAPAIVVTKNIVDDGLVQNPDGTYSVTYEVLVTNAGAAPGQYELNDELTFGEGITITSAIVESTVPDTLVTDPTWNGQTALDITVAPVAIDGTDDDAGTSQHVYRVVVTGDASGIVSATAGDCTLDQAETGTGYLNTAFLTVEGTTTQDDACDPDPGPSVTVLKTLTAGPTLAADGTFALEYQLVVTNTGGFGTYDLDDTIAFGGGVTVVPDTPVVEVITPANGSIEAGAGWVGDLWDGGTNAVITTGQSIAPGGSHTYVIRVSAAVDPLVIDYDVDAACPPPNDGDQGGFLNIANVAAGGVEQSDDACAPVPLPAVALSKTITSGPTDLGDGTYEITYDIVVTNNGDGPDAYVLDDELRFGDGITILTAVATNVAPGSITVSPDWNGTSDARLVTDEPIAGMTSHTYRVVTTVDALTVLTTDDGACTTTDALETGGFLNVALLSSYSTTTTANDCDEVPLPDISIAKAIATGPTERVAEPGVYDITYDVVVSNAGPGSGRYDLSDDLAFGEGVSVLSASVASTDVTTDVSAWSGSGVIVTDEPIANGVSHTYRVTVVASVAPSTLTAARDCVLGDGENGTGLRNVAGVSGPLVTPQEATACAPIPNPSISVAKTVVSPATQVSGLNYDITYRIVATNAGAGIGEYDIDDTLAFGAGVTVVSSAITSSDVDVSGTAWNGTTITDVLDDVALPGASSHTYTVQVRFRVPAAIAPSARDCVVDQGEDGTGVLNTVTITVPTSPTPIVDDACDEIPAPEMTVTKTVVSGPTLNSNGTYSISYRVVARNIGDGPGVYDLVDQPTFGPAITITSATVASPDVTLPVPPTWNPIAGQYGVASGVALPAGASDTYTMTFVTTIDPVKLDGTLATCVGGHGTNESEYFNRIDIYVDGALDDTDTACEPPPVPKLEIEKSVSPTTLTPTADGVYEVVYTIKVSNTGNGPTTYTVTDSFAFADGVEVLSVAVISKPATATLIPGFDGNTRNKVATAPLPAKTTHTYQIKVRVDASGVTSEEAFDCDLDPGETGTGLLNRATVNPTDEACVEIPKFADLELTKVISPDSVEIGKNATFTIYVTNVGPVDTTGVTVTEQLPAGLTYVSHKGDGTYNRSTGVWNIGDLAVGEAATLDIVVRVDREGKITNTAQVRTSDLPDPDSTPGNSVPTEDDQDSATVTGRAVVVVLPPTPPPVTLPPTGSETGSPIHAAVWLLLIGGAMLAVASRRRREI